MIVDAWIVVAALAMFVYLAVAGYELGIGILMAAQRDSARRRQWAALVNTTWDGNESWFLLVAALLLAGVPGAYTVLVPTMAVPLTVMVVALITRRIAVVAMRTPMAAQRWASVLFAATSLLVAFSQGVTVTALTQTAASSPTSTDRDVFAFVSWYSIVGGLTATAVYAAAGAVWATHTAQPPVQHQARRAGTVAMPVAAALVAVTAALMPNTAVPSDWDQRLILIACATLAGTALGAGWNTKRRTTWYAATTIVAAEVAALGIIISIQLADTLPPPTHTHTATPTSALYLTLIALAPCMPIVLFLNAYTLWNFLHHARMAGASGPNAVSPLGSAPRWSSSASFELGGAGSRHRPSAR